MPLLTVIKNSKTWSQEKGPGCPPAARHPAVGARLVSHSTWALFLYTAKHNMLRGRQTQSSETQAEGESDRMRSV